MHGNWIFKLSWIWINIISQVEKTCHRTNLIYVKAEDTEAHGNYSISIPKKRVKEEVCKNLIKSHNCVWRIDGNTAARPELKYVLDSDASLLESKCFSQFMQKYYRPTISTLFRILYIYYGTFRKAQGIFQYDSTYSWK